MKEEKENSTLDKVLKDIELDEILSSMKQNGNRINDLLDEKPFVAPNIDEIAPPKPKITEQKDSIEKQEIEEQEDKTTIPPEPKTKKEKIEKPKVEKKPKEKVVKPKKDKQSKPKKFSQPRIKLPDFSKLKNLPKRAKILIGAILAIIVAAILIIVVVQGNKASYIKEYEALYNIKYPSGISEEFCDAYGKDQELVGQISIPDLDKKPFIYTSSDVLKPHFDTGSVAEANQQFKAISINSSITDIESIYSTAESYVNQSQEILFTDIYSNQKKYQVVASYYVTTNSLDDNGYLFPYNLYGDLTEDSFNEFEDRISTRSLFYSGYDMSYNDKFLTISTDSDFMKDFRFVILCVEVDGDIKPYTTTTENTNIHYPQVWYDETGNHNSYWLASKWQPEIYTDSTHTKTKKIM